MALATGSAAELASPGITVSVPDNSTTTLRATATDARGTLSACSAGLAYLEDSTPPDTTISSGPSGPINVTSASFAFSSEAGTSLQCRLDGAAFSACTSPKSYSALADGPHTFEVRAVDQAGNADPTPAARSFTVDTQAPAAPSLSRHLARLAGKQQLAQSQRQRRGRLGGADLLDLWLQGTPLATGSAAELASPGITVSVPDNSTTTLRATATDCGRTSRPARQALAYVEDSTAARHDDHLRSLRADQRLHPDLRILLEPVRLDVRMPLRRGRVRAMQRPRGDPHARPPLWPTAPTPSRCARSTRPATSTPTPATRSFSVDTQPPDTTITAGPSGNTNDRRPTFSFTSSVAGVDLPVQPRQFQIRRLHFAKCLFQPVFWRPRIPGQGNRPGRKRRPDAGGTVVHDHPLRPEPVGRFRSTPFWAARLPERIPRYGAWHRVEALWKRRWQQMGPTYKQEVTGSSPVPPIPISARAYLLLRSEGFLWQSLSRMPRTPLARRFGEAASVASEAAARQMSADEVLADRPGRLRRRELLAGGAGLAVSAALGGRLSRAFAGIAPRIVVVGAAWRASPAPTV